MKNDICVVTPVYKQDNADFFKLALESLFSQSLSVDVVIVCDGPLSSILDDLLSTFEIKDNVTILRMVENKGLPKALNFALNYALAENYKYIGRMDADDISDINRFLKQYTFMIENPDVDVCCSNAEFIDNQNNHISYSDYAQTPSIKSMMNKCEVIHPSVLMKAKLFYKIGFYDEELIKSQDLDLWLRILNSGLVIHCLPDLLLKFRYDDFLIKRRKKEQVYNINIKKKYITNFFQYRFLLKNYFIRYTPVFVLKIILRLK